MVLCLNSSDRAAGQRDREEGESRGGGWEGGVLLLFMYSAVDAVAV